MGGATIGAGGGAFPPPCKGGGTEGVKIYRQYIIRM